MKKQILLLPLCLFLLSNIERPTPIKELPEKTGLTILKSAYPNEIDEIVYDYKLNAWAMILRDSNGRKIRLFWAEGRILTADRLTEAYKYRTQFYPYPEEIKNPATMDDEYIRKLNAYTSKNARKNSAISAPDFFDTIYDARSRQSLESHLVKTSFLGKKTTVHEKIEEPLKRVEKTIYRRRLWSPEIRSFIRNLSSCDCYHWREVRDTGSRSFHSYAIAVDILPKGWGNKIIYWSWERDRNPNWMLVPIEKRWCPPQAVIDAFEAEGFIWGGKWDIWDNMHFEYRPELFLFREYEK